MKRRSSKFYIPPKYILRACLVLCVGLLILSFRFEGLFHPIKTAAGNIITPMQKGINTVGSYISEKLDGFANTKKLIAENEHLKQKIEALEEANTSIVMDQYELNSLRSLYAVGEKYADYPKVAARVTSKDSNSYYSVFTIDKGAEDGISVDMNVLAPNGLCGIVIEVGKNYSKVRSIIDDASYVSGMFLRTSDTCDIKGDLQLLDSGYIRVEAISAEAKIEDNFEVVTSHISDKYLPGILIGYISNIEVDSNNLTKRAYLSPVVDFEHLDDVLVITQLKEPFETLSEEDKTANILEVSGKLTDANKQYVAGLLNSQLSESKQVDFLKSQFSSLSDESKQKLMEELSKQMELNQSEGKVVP